jgi:hypothetical protein
MGENLKKEKQFTKKRKKQMEKIEKFGEFIFF